MIESVLGDPVERDLGLSAWHLGRPFRPLPFHMKQHAHLVPPLPHLLEAGLDAANAGADANVQPGFFLELAPKCLSGQFTEVHMPAGQVCVFSLDVPAEQNPPVSDGDAASDPFDVVHLDVVPCGPLKGEAMDEPRKPRRLGRGLNSLIAPATPVRIDLPAEEPKPTPTTEGVGGPSTDFVRMISVEQVQPSPFQPRRRFDESGLSALADSIARSGLMQPIVVRPRADGFELVAGERRWRAAQRAGLTHVPASVHALDDAEAAEWALVENLQREDLNPIERGAAFRALADRFGLSHAEIGERVGLDRSSVANMIRLTELEAPIQQLVGEGRLSMGQARAVLGVAPGDGRVRLAQRAAEEQWTTRKIEAAVREAKRHKVLSERPELGVKTPAARAAALMDLEKQLGEHLGTKVSITTDGSGARGKLTLRFYSLDHFDGLMAKLGFEPNA